MISDATTKTQQFAQIESDATLRSTILAMPGQMKFYDTSQAILDTLRLRPYIVSAGVPTLVIQGTKTNKIVAVKCPGTSAEIVTAVKLFAGK